MDLWSRCLIHQLLGKPSGLKTSLFCLSETWVKAQACNTQHRCFYQKSSNRGSCQHSAIRPNVQGSFSQNKLQGSSSLFISAQIPPFLQAVRYAGHSKWQNRRHIKGAKDAAKGKVAIKASMNIRIAIREGGSSNPKLNNQLARAIRQARSADVPNSTIETAIKAGEKAKDSGKMITMEAKGPANSFIILEAFTDNVGRTRQRSESYFKKFGGQLCKEGTASYNFETKGLLQVAIEDNVPSDLDAAEELAIEVGAEEVQKVTEDEQDFLQFLCDKSDFGAVRKNLEGMEYNLSKAKLILVPTNHVELDSKMLEYVAKLYDILEAECDVVEIYDNIREEGEKS